MADNMRGSAGEENGPQTDRALQISPLNQRMLDQCIKNILADHEKANDLIHEHMRNLLEEQMNALRKQYEDSRKRTDELQKQLADRDSQLQTTRFQLRTANAQLETNTLEMKTVKTRMAELERTNTDVITKNQELEEFQSDFDQLFKRKKRSMQPARLVQAPDVEENSKASALDVVANPVAQDLPAAAHRLDTAVTPMSGNSVSIVTEVAATGHSCSSQSSVDHMPPQVPILAALIPESALPTPLNISFDSGTSDHVMGQKMHDIASEASNETIHLESPQVTRPKKKLTFSPHSPGMHTIQPVPVVTGKRKHTEQLITAHVCKVCLVGYDSHAGLRRHSCPSQLYGCSIVGCGKTFQTPSAKRCHEKTHTDKEETTEQRTEPLVTAHVCKTFMVECELSAYLCSSPFVLYKCSFEGCGTILRIPSLKRHHEKTHAVKVTIE